MSAQTRWIISMVKNETVAYLPICSILVRDIGGFRIMTKVKTFTVALPVTDLNSAVEWYRQLLGEVEEINPAPGVWEFQIVSSGWLQLFEREINNPNLAVVRFESDDIEASRMQALSLGTDVGEIETVPEAVRYFEFRDPFGNQLSFYELLE
jgi:lactoylglutathione lyase